MAGIAEKIGTPALLEQTAEEAAELANAALKLARLMRGENPTPKTVEDCLESLTEEAAGIELCISLLWSEARVISLQEICRTMNEKRDRWQRRLGGKDGQCID